MKAFIKKATIKDYLIELIEIVEHPENSNKAWKETVISEAKKILNL